MSGPSMARRGTGERNVVILRVAINAIVTMTNHVLQEHVMLVHVMKEHVM